MTFLSLSSHHVSIVLVLTVMELFGGRKSIAASAAIVNAVQFNGSMGPCCQVNDLIYLSHSVSLVSLA